MARVDRAPASGAKSSAPQDNTTGRRDHVADASDIKAAEAVVLKVLRRSGQPMAIHEVIESSAFEPTRLKIAAMNLVSSGLAKLNDRWELIADGRVASTPARRRTAAA